MRRLLAATVFAASAFGLAAPAHAAVECYGARGGRVINAGVCAGSYCPDVCFVVVDPYCQSDTITKQDAIQPCHIVDGIDR
jgi:hypothetical protein